MKEIKVVKVPKLEIAIPILESTPTLQVQINNPSIEETINKFLSGEITLDEYNKILSEVIIRFNTEPRKYEKADYRKLIQAIIGLLKILEKRIGECEDRITATEETIEDHEERLSETELKVSVLETINVVSTAQDVIGVSRNGMTFTIDPLIPTEITDTVQEGEDRKIATVSSIRNYINNKLNWNVI